MSKGLITALFILLAFMAGLFAYTRQTKPAYQTEERFLMATWTKITLPKKPFAQNEKAFTQAFAAMDQVEQMASRFIETSELNRLNSGGWHQISQDMLPLFDKAEELYLVSGGRFDVTAGKLISLYGFGPEGVKKAPTKEQLEKALALTGFDKLTRSNSWVHVPEGMQLDFNALAAGYAADKAAKILDSLGYDDYLIDAGGEIVCKAKSPHEWLVGVKEPNMKQSQSSVDVKAMANGSISTSGSYANYYKTQSNAYTHIVDARSGSAALSPLVSVSVTAHDGITSDGYSTLLFVTPLKEAYLIAEKDSELEALFIVSTPKGLTQLKTKGWDKK